MKIQAVTVNGRQRAFHIELAGRQLRFPFAKCDPRPGAADRVVFAEPDAELDNDAFTYRLKSGGEGTVHVEQILDYNKDPSYLRDMMVYDLTLEAQRRVAATALSKREVIRRLGTSPTQFYRLLDQTNTSKSVDQMLRLLNALDCDVRFIVQAKSA